MYPIIKVRGLGKEYRVGGSLAHSSLREAITYRFSSGRNGNAHDQVNRFWALQDVSFEVQPGEIIGIIGRNGAGKSTLLRLIQGMIEADGGNINMTGRMRIG